MKTKSYLIGLLLMAAGLFIITQNKTTAQNQRQNGATVILGYRVASETINGVYRETGMKIKWVSRSHNVPEIPVDIDIAPVMALLQDEGFVMEPPSPRPEYIFNRRPR